MVGGIWWLQFHGLLDLRSDRHTLLFIFSCSFFNLILLLTIYQWGRKFGEEAIHKLEDALPLKKAPGIDDTADAFIAVIKNKSQTGCAISVDGGQEMTV